MAGLPWCYTLRPIVWQQLTVGAATNVQSLGMCRGTKDASGFLCALSCDQCSSVATPTRTPTKYPTSSYGSGGRTPTKYPTKYPTSSARTPTRQPTAQPTPVTGCADKVSEQLCGIMAEYCKSEASYGERVSHGSSCRACPWSRRRGVASGSHSRWLPGAGADRLPEDVRPLHRRRVDDTAADRTAVARVCAAAAATAVSLPQRCYCGPRW